MKLTHVLAGQLNAIFLPRLLDCFDYRICHYDRSADPRLPEYNEHCVITFWHEYIISILPRWGHTPVTALVSMHRDGEWVNQTAISLGMSSVRGSSSRGGATALRQLKQSLKYSSIAMTPDGPRGPRRVMAPGPIFLAAKFQVPLVPMGVAITNPHRLNTWDKFAIPKPGSRLRVIIGPKIRIPKKLSRADLDRYRLEYERLQNDLCEVAERWAESKLPMPGEMKCTQTRRTTKLFFENEPSRPIAFGELNNVPEETTTSLESLKSIRSLAEEALWARTA